MVNGSRALGDALFSAVHDLLANLAKRRQADFCNRWRIFVALHYYSTDQAETLHSHKGNHTQISERPYAIVERLQTGLYLSKLIDAKRVEHVNSKRQERIGEIGQSVMIRRTGLFLRRLGDATSKHTCSEQARTELL